MVRVVLAETNGVPLVTSPLMKISTALVRSGRSLTLQRAGRWRSVRPSVTAVPAALALNLARRGVGLVRVVLTQEVIATSKVMSSGLRLVLNGEAV